jgi:hypothetical protein
MSGPRSVPNQAAFTVYGLLGAENATKITWKAPTGAEILSGQGTANAVIKWGGSSGEVSAEVETACGKKQLKVFVRVEPGLARERALENFDENSPLKLTQSSGTFTDNFANPSKTGINTSELVGRYVRNAGSQFDIIVYEGSPITDLSPFLNKERKFFIDVYTNAPVGTEILFQAENSTRAQQNYPTGRHSRYQAFTTKQNEWERLELTFLDRPDAGTASTAINRYVLLFRPNTLSTHTYHFDNLDAYAPIASSVRDVLVDAERVFKLSPNPGDSLIRLENVDEQPLVQATLLSIEGKVLQSSTRALVSKEILEWEVSRLPAGTYLVQVLRADGKMALSKWIKSK